MKKSLVRCIVYNQEKGCRCLEENQGYYAGIIEGRALYIYKRPDYCVWHIIDENTGASIGNYQTRQKAVQGLEYAARMLNIFIEKNPEKYNQYCDYFTNLFSDYLRMVNANA